MSALKSVCPNCGSGIEIPSDFANVLCSTCGALYNVKRLEGSVGLRPAAPAHTGAEPGATAHNAQDAEIGQFMALTERLGLIDEDIESVSADLELIRSKQQGAPLQFGCAMFGIFGLVVVTMAFFATVGKSLFGGWLFYLAVAAIVLGSIKGLARKLMSPAERRSLGLRRSRLQAILEQLRTERESVVSVLNRRENGFGPISVTSEPEQGH